MWYVCCLFDSFQHVLCRDFGAQTSSKGYFAVYLSFTLAISPNLTHHAAIVFANAGGPPGRGYAGLSQVVVPFVGALTRLGSSAEGMSVVDVDMQILEEAEENYQVRSDLAKADWHYDYRHGKEKEKL